MPLASAHTAATLGRLVLALIAGVATGAALVAGFIYSSLGEALVFEGLFLVALFYGAAIAVVCVPVWLSLARVGWDRAPAAAALGFVATLIFVLLTTAAGSHERLDLLAYSVVPYAVCGALAALVTWLVGTKLQI